MTIPRTGTIASSLLILIILCLAATAWSAAPKPRMVEVIIDASGSMMGQLKSGETRLEAAKKAVAELIPALPPETILALRAYGHQSPTSKKDCQDTQLLVPFGPAGQTGAEAVAKAKALKAQGYTPITHVLTLAAGDFPDSADQDKVIVLVSDGKETCQGDPCAAAKALAKSKARLVIHTVGLGVDEATRAQLECLARVSGGRYFPAASAAELAQMLRTAVATAQVKVEEKKGDGWLEIPGADLTGHKVTNAETGQLVTEMGHTKSVAKLPAGIYNVTIGPAVWTGVQIRAGEKTILRPGRLTVEHANVSGHRILEMETGREMGSVGHTQSSVAVMPGEYVVTFGHGAVWPIKIEAGQALILKPGRITVKGASIQGVDIKDAQGHTVGNVSPTGSTISLPPGEYVIELASGPVKVNLEEGQRTELSLR